MFGKSDCGALLVGMSMLISDDGRYGIGTTVDQVAGRRKGRFNPEARALGFGVATSFLNTSIGRDATTKLPSFTWRFKTG